MDFSKSIDPMKQKSKTANKFIEQIFEFINPKKNPDLNTAFKHQLDTLPTLWMLGKTGAGKSSIIQHITGNTASQVGTGFKPCTQTADSF
ncbi:MAG: putative ribosome biogenesis GTPase RsgA, partial [Paraglaciecola psychrophila]